MPRPLPFSGKQKKIQLQLRRVRKKEEWEQRMKEEERADELGAPDPQQSLVGATGEDRLKTYTREVVSINKQKEKPGSSRAGRNNRFHLQFSKEKMDWEFEKSKTAMHEVIQHSDPATLEYTSEQFFPNGLTFPERPKGYRQMTKDVLEQHENKSVRVFGEAIETQFGESDINLYEQNTETWKQLWRVLDKSNVLLFIVDMRFAVCQFPPYVYRQLSAQRRGVVLVLSKVDLVPAAVVLGWQRYFRELCPGMQVVAFCSHESIVDRRRKQRMAIHSCRALVDAVEEVGGVSLPSWRAKLERAAEEQSEACEELEELEDEEEGEEDLEEETENENREEEEDIEDVQSYHEGANQDIEGSSVAGRARVFTIGTIGYPNVGKSSLINAVMGKYKVSVSRNPGHTKHFQTHYLTSNRDLMLCDCPGLVFPALCPFDLQILSGTFPISQVRGPMAVIGFLASHINVPRALGIKFPDDYKDDMDVSGGVNWTPFIVSEAWAQKRHYNIKGKGGRLDSSRAANELLRLSLAAKNKLVLCLKPPGYSVDEVSLRNAADIDCIRLIQGLHADEAIMQERVLGFGPIPKDIKLGQLAHPQDLEKCDFVYRSRKK